MILPNYVTLPVSYDNMCNIDRLKLLKKPLPLPAPEDKLWSDTVHLIDELHLRNHSRKSCHEKYNPEILKKNVPDSNLVCCEEIFAWQSRFRRILCSMKTELQNVTDMAAISV